MAVASVLVLGVIGVQTLRLNHAKSEITSMKAQEKAAEAAVALRTAQQAAISQAASSKLSEAQAATVVKYRTLIERVPVSVPASADKACQIDAPFISLWNAAGAGL